MPAPARATVKSLVPVRQADLIPKPFRCASCLARCESTLGRVGTQRLSVRRANRRTLFPRARHRWTILHEVTRLRSSPDEISTHILARQGSPVRQCSQLPPRLNGPRTKPKTTTGRRSPRGVTEPSDAAHTCNRASRYSRIHSPPTGTPQPPRNAPPSPRALASRAPIVLVSQGRFHRHPVHAGARALGARGYQCAGPLRPWRCRSR